MVWMGFTLSIFFCALHLWLNTTFLWWIFTASAYFTACIYHHLAILSFICNLGDFQFGAVMNDVAMNILVYVPCVPPSPVQELLHDTYPQVELMGHRVWACSVLLGNNKLFPSVAVTIYTSTSSKWQFLLSHNLASMWKCPAFNTCLWWVWNDISLWFQINFSEY